MYATPFFSFLCSNCTVLPVAPEHISFPILQSIYLTLFFLGLSFPTPSVGQLPTLEVAIQMSPFQRDFPYILYGLSILYYTFYFSQNLSAYKTIYLLISLLKCLPSRRQRHLIYFYLQLYPQHPAWCSMYSCCSLSICFMNK